MTEIAFHFNAADKLAYSCRLLRKAVASGARVVVTGPADVLDQLDQALWVLSATDFVPHCGPNAPNQVLQHTPVVLLAAGAVAPFHDIVVNLGADVPSGFEQFQRVIEVVTAQDDDRLAARARWRQYAASGFKPLQHDLQRPGRP